VIAAQLTTTCQRIDRWLDVAVDESELSAPRQSFFVDGGEPPMATATTTSTPAKEQYVAEPAEPSVFEVRDFPLLLCAQRLLVWLHLACAHCDPCRALHGVVCSCAREEEKPRLRPQCHSKSMHDSCACVE
jgi:hypothetical protein